VEQADAERPAGGPPGRDFEAAKSKIGMAPALLGNGEDGDKDGEETGEGPKNGEGLEASLLVGGLLEQHADMIPIIGTVERGRR
jgi:hypothetical protein